MKLLNSCACRSLLLRLAATDCVATVCCLGTAAVTLRLTLPPGRRCWVAGAARTLSSCIFLFGCFCLPCPPGPLYDTARRVSEVDFGVFLPQTQPTHDGKAFTFFSGRKVHISKRFVANTLINNIYQCRDEADNYGIGKQNEVEFPFIVLKPVSSAVGSDGSFLSAATQENTCFSHIALHRCHESSTNSTRVATKLGERMLH